MPRPLYAVDDGLHMLFFAEAYGYTQEDIDQVVTDYSDAFCIMPLPSTREGSKSFAGEACGSYC